MRPRLVILTGFLGAGKTTLLNRVLGARHDRRLAVIVNELGRIDVDGKILKARSGDVMELAGGCVCHEVRTQDELWQAMAELRARSRPELFVLETTGIAEPAPILAGLAAFPDDERPADAAGVITVVDAEAGAAQLDRFAEARAQVADADAVVLSKLDLVDGAAASALHARLTALNARAERVHFPATPEGTAELVTFLLAPRAALHDHAHAPHDDEHTEKHGAGHHAHEHSQLVAASYVDDVPLLPEPLLAVVNRWGDALVRAKGFVDIAGDDRRGFLERAGARTELRFLEPWPPGARRTEIVLIGLGLDAAALKRQLWACRAPMTTR